MHAVHCLSLGHGVPVGFDNMYLGCDTQIDAKVFESRV